MFPITENASLTWQCESSGLVSSLLNSFLLCISIAAFVVNMLLLFSLAHLSYLPDSRRFQGIRRSMNRGHPHFRFKRRGVSESVRARSPTFEVNTDHFAHRRFDPTSDKLSSFSASLCRSPSCPENLLSPTLSSMEVKIEESRYWLSHLNIGRKKSFRSPPQPRPRITTPLYLVYSLILADLLNSTVTGARLISTLWPKNHVNSYSTGYYYRRTINGPCMILFLSCLQFTAYNGVLLSIVGLAIDLYLGIVHSLQYSGLERPRLLKYLISGWIVSLLFGSNQLFLPVFEDNPKVEDTNPFVSCSPLVRHFLLPSEPCFVQTKQLGHRIQRFCYLQGAANMYRSGFFTGGILLLSTLLVNIMCALAIFRLKKQSSLRTPAGRNISNWHRSHSLPIVNKLGAVVFSLHGKKAETKTSSLAHGTKRQLLRSFCPLLTLLVTFLILFTPGLVLEIYIITRPRSTSPSSQDCQFRFEPWVYDLISNLPTLCSLVNPFIYSLRLNGTRLGMRNLYRRITSRFQKGFIEKQLHLHKKHIFLQPNVQDNFRIKLPSGDSVAIFPYK
uniref:7 transmembrane receptor (Rhodopsin family) n=1 Tax=Schistocephalus solidus TaxID=70667 RepID=A0A0X3PYY6_SCHSO